MAGGLLQYSGILAKTRAMHGRLLTREDFLHFTEIETVHETIAYLREQESYGRIYSGHDEIEHRGQAEAVIHNSIIRDYQSLYSFAGPMQRQELKLYEPQLQYGESVPELDISYFSDVWKELKQFKGVSRKVLTEIYGTQIDWLNIMWMYRAKRFFGQSPKEIHAMLIPVHYRLKTQEVEGLLMAEQMESFQKILAATAYFRGQEALIQMQDEISYHQVMNRMYRKVCRKYPCSIAPVYRYLHEKELEIEHLTTAIEGIRYQIPAKDIRALILNIT